MDYIELVSIYRELESTSKRLEKTKAQIYIWSGSNYGGCDLPFYLDKYDFDLLINFGHARFKR